MVATKGRLLIDGPAEGSWNMAVDQALLETAESTGQTTLRIYYWEPATVSLGYFQNHEDRNQHSASLTCPMVRRKTGGGAIVHDQEITYSLCIPSNERWSKKNRELYDLVHLSLIDILETHKIKAHLFGAPSLESSELPSKDSFLCFERRAVGDLIVDNQKVGGSAQRRLKRSLLQHGSILLKRSSFAPELPGIGDLAGHYFEQEEFANNWIDLLSKYLSMELHCDSLSPVELACAKEVQRTQFASSVWNENR